MDDFLNKLHHGRWWDSRRPDLTFNGILSFGEDNQAILVIRGKERDLPLVDYPRELTTMVGRLTSEPMDKISVLNARRVRGPTNTHPPSEDRETEVEFYGSRVVVGAHVEDTNTPLINRLRFSLTDLEDWCAISRISGKSEVPDRTPDLGGEINEFDSVEVSFHSGTTDYFDIGDGKRLRFLSLYRGPLSFHLEKEVTLRVRNRIELIFPDRISVDKAVEEMRIWQTFISLGLGIPVFLEDILLRRDADHKNKPVDLIVTERKWNPEKPRLYPYRVLLNQSKLGAKLGECLKAWRQKQEKIDVSVLLYRGASYLHDAYIHINTLTYLQALEVHHGELYTADKFPNSQMKRDTLKALRSAIPKELDEGLREEISQSLGWIGQLSLRDRLKSLFDHYPKSLRPLFPVENQLDDLRRARNYLTHYSDDKDLTKDFMSSREVYVVGQKGRMFLEICFLGAMDMSDDDIFELLKSHSVYGDLCAEAKYKMDQARRTSS